MSLEVIQCHRPGMFVGEELDQPLTHAPPATCEQCGCRLSRYRVLGETRCAPCLGPAQYHEPNSNGATRAKGGSIAPLVLNTLAANGPLTGSAIATRAGVPRSSVKYALQRLTAEGRVRWEGDYHRPTYRLV